MSDKKSAETAPKASRSKKRPAAGLGAAEEAAVTSTEANNRAGGEAGLQGNMTERAGRGLRTKKSVAPTTPPAGGEATSAAAEAATTATATKKGAAGGGTRTSSRKTAPGPSTGGDDDLDSRVRQRAYEIWEAEGYPHGRHDDHWAQARRELTETGGKGSPTKVKRGQDRAGVVAPPSVLGQPGASEALDGTPSALRTSGRSRRGKA